MAGSIFILILALTAICADFIAPYEYQEQDLERYREGPSSAHLLGTDSYGRDVLSRLIYGGRVSLSVGLVAVIIAQGIAVVLGSIAGYYGGASDWIVMRLVDVVMAFPWLIMVIMMVSLLGPSVFNAMLAIGILGWTIPTRLVRGQILAIREMDYILAARSVGVKARRIISRHILPGVVGPLVVSATFMVASAILMEAGLSFLGLGVQPPIASWGNMMIAAMELIILEDMPWLWVPPGADGGALRPRHQLHRRRPARRLRSKGHVGEASRSAQTYPVIRVPGAERPGTCSLLLAVLMPVERHGR